MTPFLPRRPRAGQPAAAPSEALSEGLVADITATTRQAAVDGLALAQVFDDLRLVLDLDAGEEIPADVLRVAALTWAEAQHALAGEGPYDGVHCATEDEVESQLWAVLAATGRPPSVALLLRAQGRSDPDAAGLALRELDLLVAAARSLAPGFSRPEEYVGLVRRAGSRSPDRVVLLVADDDRVDEALASIAGLSPAGGPTLVVTRHDLGENAEGALAALRDVLGQPAG